MLQLPGRSKILLSLVFVFSAVYSAVAIAAGNTAAELLDKAAGLQRAGRLESAQATYKELLGQELSGTLREELLRRSARLNYQLAQYQQSRELYQKQLQEFPQGKHAPEGLAMLAWVHLAEGETDYADQQFRLLHAKFPQSAQAPEAAYWLALTSADEKDSVEALRYVDWLIRELSPAEKRSSERLKQIWHRGLCLKCQLAAETEQWHAIKDLLAENYEHMDEGAYRTKVLFWSAEAEFRTRNFDQARLHLSELQSRTIGIHEPWVAMVPLRRAQLAARRQQWSEVLKIIEPFEKNYLDFQLRYEVDYLKGRALAGCGKMSAARRSYQRVLENLSAQNTETAARAQWMIGETFFHQRDYTRAREAYTQVLEYQSESDWQARAALQAGKCWELQEDWKQARSVYKQALNRWHASESGTQLQARLRWTEKQLR